MGDITQMAFFEPFAEKAGKNKKSVDNQGFFVYFTN
jgi:hypothetical protein